jgi:hypothetical protein
MVQLESKAIEEGEVIAVGPVPELNDHLDQIVVTQRSQLLQELGRVRPTILVGNNKPRTLGEGYTLGRVRDQAVATLVVSGAHLVGRTEPVTGQGSGSASSEHQEDHQDRYRRLPCGCGMPCHRFKPRLEFKGNGCYM